MSEVIYWSILSGGSDRAEPATSCVTGRRSNQTELHPHGKMVGGKGLEPMTLSCKRDALLTS